MKQSKYKTTIGLIISLLLITQTYYIYQNNFKNNEEIDTPIINNEKLSENDYILNDEPLVITKEGEYTISGNSNESITINTNETVKLILDNVNINSKDNAAISVINAKEVIIYLKENTINTLSDSNKRSDESINGVIYSNSDLIIEGSGTLNVEANFEDAIVSKSDLLINNGNINVKAVDDGIRAKNSLNIKGGIINVDAVFDGINTNNNTDINKGHLSISDGSIILSVGNDGIKSNQLITISGGDIDIKTSTEGIEAPTINIDGGNINIYATDDGINASASDVISSNLSININGGNLYVEVGPGDTDALDSNGDLNITGGTVSLVGNSTVDFDGVGKFTGGTLIINNKEVSELPSQMMGPNNMGTNRRP